MKAKSKQETMMLQGLIDWMEEEYEETGRVPSVEEMYMYLLRGYDKVYDEEYLDDLREEVLDSLMYD